MVRSPETKNKFGAIKTKILTLIGECLEDDSFN